MPPDDLSETSQPCGADSLRQLFERIMDFEAGSLASEVLLEGADTVRTALEPLAALQRLPLAGAPTPPWEHL